MLALALLVALDIAGAKPSPTFVVDSDTLLCGDENFADLIAKTSRAQPLHPIPSWSDADVVVLVPTRAQLALDRGAFMKLMHTKLDLVRAAAPRAWIVLAAPELKSAREWLNAIVHKRGDGRLSFVVVPSLPGSPSRFCAAYAAAIASEINSRLD